jgi:hypothetical protein
VIQNTGCGIPYVEEHLKQRPMLPIGSDTLAQRLGVLEWRQTAIDPTTYWAERDLLGSSLELVAPFCAAQANDDTRTLQFKQIASKNFSASSSA